jgi:hypothetical protein
MEPDPTPTPRRRHGREDDSAASGFDESREL